MRRHHPNRRIRNGLRRARRTRSRIRRAFERAVDRFELELGETLARLREAERAA